MKAQYSAKSVTYGYTVDVSELVGRPIRSWRRRTTSIGTVTLAMPVLGKCWNN